MNKTSKIVISITSIIFGWLLGGFGFTTTFGHPLSTICFLSGIGLFLGGLIFLIAILIRK
ncbi:MAG TPA: hypothetical protein VK169_01145 [Saprospiraceae bacterium]|nr:hypothetical protein [Saprospiraceae bacterium]